MRDYFVRTAIHPDEVHLRIMEANPSALPVIRSGLKKLHTFEIMAANIYKYQIRSNEDAFNRIIIQAMANEMTHVQDFQIKLYEYGSKPSMFRWMFWIAGMLIGCTTRLMGQKAIVKAGIWVEQKAVDDYQRILDSAPWDPETRSVIERNMQDEYHHIQTFQDHLS